MPLLGAHMSIAGGYYKAVDEAGSFGMEVVQIFTKNNNQWAGKPIADEDVRLFRDALTRHGVGQPISHASYLINLAAPADELWEKSIEAMAIELQRAERLGVKYVVVHPGAFTTTCEEEGIERVAVAVNRVHDLLHAEDFQAEILLENTAGQGSCLGHDFAHLGAMLARIERSDRVGVCFDTCHAFAAGHGFDDAADFDQMKREIDETFGLEKIRAVHLNDSKKPRGSRVDRHEHIGEGLIGMEGFRRFVTDSFFGRLPMYLETPKDQRDGEHSDAINLRTVRDLAAGRSILPKPSVAVATENGQASMPQRPAKKNAPKKGAAKKGSARKSEALPKKSSKKASPKKKATAKQPVAKKKSAPRKKSKA
jgi:deoxyribonuclease-4